MNLLKLLSNQEVRPSATLDFSTSLPSGFTYTRNDTAATYRDADGNLQAGVANTPRFDHDASGNPLGMLMAAARTNKCTNESVNPTTAPVTDGWVIAGTGATLSLVDDTAKLAAAGLGDICSNGKVFLCDNTGGTGTARFEIPGTSGNTNPHSGQMYMRGESNAYCGYLGWFGGTVYPQVLTTDYDLKKLENVSPSATIRKLSVFVTQGHAIYCILNSWEEAAFCSNPIIAAGAAGTTADDKLTISNPSNNDWFNNDEGTLLVKVTMLEDSVVPQQNLISAQNGTGTTTNAYVIRAQSGRSKMASTVYVASSSKLTGDTAGFKKGQSFWSGFSWKQGRFISLAGAAIYNESTDFTTPAAGLDRIEVCGATFSAHAFCHLEQMLVFKKSLTVEQAGRVMVEEGELLVDFTGQSLATGMFSSQIGAGNEGQKAGLDEFNSYYPDTVNRLVNGGTAGTTVAYYSGTSTASNWWIDMETGALGVPFLRHNKIMRGCRNGTFIAGVDVSGQSDAGQITKEDFKAAQLVKFSLKRSINGNAPEFIANIGSNTNADYAGYQTIREANMELAAEYDWIYLLPEYYDLTLEADGLHTTPASNVIMATRIMRHIAKTLGKSVTGSTIGASVGTPTRSGDTVTIPIVHDGGTDIAPSTGIEGFVFIYNGSPIAFNSVVRTNATTVTGTLASTPGGAGTLYYGHNSLGSVNKANILKDNSTQALPLQAGKWSVT